MAKLRHQRGPASGADLVDQFGLHLEPADRGAVEEIAAGVGRTPAAAAGILLLLQPVAGASVAWPLFGEALTAVQLGGAALILAGVWLAGRS